MPSAENFGQGRQMWRALAISLLAHAWLLASGWPKAASSGPAGALQVSLRPVVASVAGEPAAPPASSAVTTTVPAGPRPAPAGERLAVMHSSDAALPTVQTSDGERASPASVAVPAIGVPGQVGAAVKTDEGGAGDRAGRANRADGPASDGVDADGLRQYRLALAREARRHKRYPERALAAGIGGTAEVRLEHAPGRPAVVELARSSGNGALDEAALLMLRAAAAHSTLPVALHGRSFVVDLPVIFDANEMP